MLDRYVELLIKAKTPRTAPDDILKAQHNLALRVAEDPRIVECSERVSRAQFDCAVNASDPDKFEQCLL